MSPFQPPFPTSWNFPFQPDSGSQVSDLMSESREGAMVMVTRQNAGRSANPSSAPAGGLNRPAETTCADVMVVFGSLTNARRAHEASVTGGLSDGTCALAVPPR